METLELKGLNILIVDDNFKNLQVLGKFLKQEGYRIEFAISGDRLLNG